MSARVTSSHLVGRAGELAECEAALHDAAAGFPSVVAVKGDSGVGKTRLIAEFEAAAGEEARFLRGECVELEGGALAYAPLISALREVSRGGEQALVELSPGGRSALGALMPALGDAPSEREDDLAQLRLFEALLELLALLARERAVVLVIEDLHWADRSTRAFAAFLARSLRHERVLFLFSYRTDELHRRHPLRALLSELDRGERMRSVTLAPWGLRELGEALADILGASPPEDLLERLFARAEGNPLYTEELLAAGLDGRGGAPQTLRDAFMLRLERLSDGAQCALQVLAVAGRADEALLGAVTAMDPEALTEALREAVAGHVVEVGAQGRLAFRHALLREVAYEDLLPGERTRLHLALAHALEERRLAGSEDPSPGAQIAAHAYAAGDRPLALRSSIAAAETASAIHAHGEAAELLERALDSWPHVADPEVLCGIDHVELLVRAAGEYQHYEDGQRAESMLSAALGELDESSDPVRAAYVLEQLARAQWALARGDEALAASRRALELLPPGRDDAARASVLAWLARTTGLRGRFREAVEAAHEALAIVEASGAGPRVESQVLNTLGMALVGSGSTEEGLAQLGEALAMAQRSGDALGAAYAHANLADLLLVAGYTAEALAVAVEGFEAVPPSLRGNHLWLAAEVAEVALARGEWELAERSLDVRGQPSQGRWLMNLSLRRAELALGRGELEHAERALREIEPLIERSLEPQFLAAHGLAHADLDRRRGRPEAARAALEQALDRIELCTDDAVRVTAIAAAGVAAEADIAQRTRDEGDSAAMRDAERRAEIHVERARSAAQSAGSVERVWVATAEAELQRALGADDPQLWTTAAAGWESLERPYFAARSRLREAEAELERGHRERAARAIADARAVAIALGSRWLVEELDGLAARARLSLPESDTEARADRAERASEQPFGLTPRELEVLVLLARGATNREIGGELLMAEKTASVHVSRILAKLNVRTRTQAAAVAHRAGLAAGAPR